MEAVKESGWTSRPTTRVTVGGMDGCCTGQDVLVSRWTETGQATTCTQVCGAVPNVGAFRRCSIRRNGVLSSKRYQRATPEVPPVCLAKTDRPKGVPVSVHPAIAARVLPGPHANLIPSPISQMEGLDYRIHARFGRHLAGARAFHFKSLSICVIGGFNSLFQAENLELGDAVFQPIRKESFWTVSLPTASWSFSRISRWR